MSRRNKQRKKENADAEMIDVCLENSGTHFITFYYLLIELLQGLITPLNQAKQVNQQMINHVLSRL